MAVVGLSSAALPGFSSSTRFPAARPPRIAQSFPTPTMEEVYGAIAFDLANRAEIDAYLARAKADYNAKRQAVRDSDPMLLPEVGDVKRDSPVIQP